MKTLLSLIVLFVALAADAAFYQYNSFTTNTYPLGQLSPTNFNNGSGASSSTFLRGDGTWVTPSGSAYAGPTVTDSNFVSGVAYTNASGRAEFVSCCVVITVAAVNGAGLMGLIVDTAGGVNFNVFNSSSIAGETTAVAITIPRNIYGTLCAHIPIGASYVFTNLSSGAGNIPVFTGRRTLTQY